MNQSRPVLQFADKNDELTHLLSLVQVEMSLLGDAADSLLRTLRIPLPVKQCRDLIPWKRGKQVVPDFEALGQHCARIAQLLREIEAEQEAPEG